MIIHEPDVAITDLILFIESILFAWLFYKQTSNHFLLRKLLILLFLSLGASSFIGALFHAFFPAKATTAEGFIVWILVAFSIGVTASTIWCINSLLVKGNKFIKITLLFSLLYLAIFMYVVIFIDYRFPIIMIFYIPPMIVLAFISFYKSYFYLLFGILLSFVAALIQYFQISIHPTIFNYNALYHLIQGIALMMIFFSFSKTGPDRLQSNLLLENNSKKPHNT